MTREEFIEKLDRERYSYKIEGDKVILMGRRKYPYSIWLDCEYIPDNIIFKNNGDVILDRLMKLPPNTKFLNTGVVELRELLTIDDIPETVVFGDGVTDLGHINSIIGDTNVPGINFIRMFRFLHNKGLISDYYNDDMPY